MTEHELRVFVRSMLLGELAESVLAAIGAEFSALAAQSPGLKEDERVEQLVGGFYDTLGVGAFEGQPVVVWQGMDLFLFPADPGSLAYTVSARHPKAGRQIRPARMWTDGGSIPRIFQGLGRKLSPWSYGPAFIIHDWLFVAHRCRKAPDTDFTLQEAGLVMAEAQKTLMEAGFRRIDGSAPLLPRSRAIVYVMYKAVTSVIAEMAWKKKVEAGECL